MENSKIQWTHHTFNPWIGCSEVHLGCDHCYARTLMATRYGRVEWGPDGTRARTSPDYWQQPLKWNRQAAASGDRIRVFCASLADIFEDRPELRPWRADLFRLIDQTPHLDWLLLTKRPQNVGRMWHTRALVHDDGHESGKCQPTRKRFRRDNVWLGTSPCNQPTAKYSIPHLLDCSDLASILFLSAEPLVGPLDLAPWLHSGRAAIDWVIVGGESGAGARPCHKEWVRTIIRHCRHDGVPVFVKQLGLQPILGGEGCDFKSKKGDDMAEWPEDLRVREFPEAIAIASPLPRRAQ